jgi:hypothetical protein
MSASAVALSTDPNVPATSVRELFKQCDDIAKAEPGDTNAIASLLQKMIVTYYADVRKQAMLTFWAALGAAGVGLLFFLYAISEAMSTQVGASSTIGLVAGGLSQFISGVNFYLYFKAARQFASFHICLERTNRFIFANTICDTLPSPLQGEVRKSLVETIALAPMLTMETATGAAQRPA